MKRNQEKAIVALLTSDTQAEAAKKWKGDGAQACLRESLDNRELALLAIGECQKMADLTGQKSEQKAGLPSSLLL